MELENEELKQKIKILEEENARLHKELEMPKLSELSATTPPTAQKMDRENENIKNNKSGTCCCFSCCTGNDTNSNNNRNRNSHNDGCCCCCCEGGGGDDCCEGGCDD